MPRKLLVAAALMAIAFFSPPGGAQAHVHPWGGHGHFVGHARGHFVGRVHGHFVGHRFAFRHAGFRGRPFAAARFGGFRGAGWGWRGGWWWHGGWASPWWWHRGWWWRSAWWWYPWWPPYAAAYGGPTHVAYHPVHPAAAPACTCNCCK